jgi:hypothetical protein
LGAQASARGGSVAGIDVEAVAKAIFFGESRQLKFQMLIAL